MRKFTTILFLLALLALIGCGAYHSLPANWDKDLPGIYEGRSSSFRETVEFKPDGTFHHKVILNDQGLVDEMGKWSTTAGRYVVDLDRFTQFYDPVARKFSNAGKEFGSYEFFPLPDGKTFYKISANVDFDYVLTRKTPSP